MSSPESKDCQLVHDEDDKDDEEKSKTVDEES